MEIVQAGWLERLSRGLRYKWKRYWFMLNRAGELMIFESPESRSPVEHKIVVYAAVVGMKVGENCNFDPPEGRSKFCLLQLKMRNGKTFRLCGDTPDERKTWHMALENARTAGPGGLAAPATAEPSSITLSGRGPYQGQILSTPGQSSQSGFQGNIFLPDHGGYEGKVLSLPGQTPKPAVVRTETNADGGQTVYVQDTNMQYVVVNDPPRDRYRRRPYYH